MEEEQVPTMDNTTGIAIASPKPNKKRVKDGGGDAKNGEEEEECDVEAWDTLSKSFKQVQSVLDHNRDLIQQVNANHQSKIPDNLVKNVSLIREINGNISKVMSIYSDLSVNFSNIVQERRRVKNGGESNLENNSNESWNQSVKVISIIFAWSCLVSQLIIISDSVWVSVACLFVLFWVVVYKLVSHLVGDCGGEGGLVVIMMVMYAYTVFVVMFYKDDELKAGFTALYPRTPQT